MSNWLCLEDKLNLQKQMGDEKMKVELEYEGSHKSLGMRVEVDKEKVDTMVKSGDWRKVDPSESASEEVVLPTEEVEQVPDDSWTEKEIKKWTDEKGIDINYKPSRDTKKYALDKLKEGGHIP